MSRKPRLASVLFGAALVLLGCADASKDEKAGGDGASPTATASSTFDSPTPETTAPVEPAGADVEIACEDGDGNLITGAPGDLEAFWSRRLDFCIDSTAYGTPSALEQQALEAAYPKDPDITSLATLYGICAENDKGWGNHLRDGGSPAQVREFIGALILCPNHPQRAKAESNIKVAEGLNDLQKQGRLFYDGTYRVGAEVKPGTYYAEPAGDSCYWERTDSTGNIIDNNFSSGLRVEMTVRSSDYSIRVEGCGQWRPVS